MCIQSCSFMYKYVCTHMGLKYCKMAYVVQLCTFTHKRIHRSSCKNRNTHVQIRRCICTLVLYMRDCIQRATHVIGTSDSFEEVLRFGRQGLHHCVRDVFGQVLDGR